MDQDTYKAVSRLRSIAQDKRQALMEQMVAGTASDYPMYQKLVGMADAYADMQDECSALLKRIHQDGPEFQ